MLIIVCIRWCPHSRRQSGGCATAAPLKPCGDMAVMAACQADRLGLSPCSAAACDRNQAPTTSMHRGERTLRPCLGDAWIFPQRALHQTDRPSKCTLCTGGKPCHSTCTRPIYQHATCHEPAGGMLPIRDALCHSWHARTHGVQPNEWPIRGPRAWGRREDLIGSRAKHSTSITHFSMTQFPGEELDGMAVQCPCQPAPPRGQTRP